MAEEDIGPNTVPGQIVSLIRKRSILSDWFFTAPRLYKLWFGSTL